MKKQTTRKKEKPQIVGMCINAIVGAVITLIITSGWNYIYSNQFTPFVKFWIKSNERIVESKILGTVTYDGSTYFNLNGYYNKKYIHIYLDFINDKFEKNVDYLMVQEIDGNKATSTYYYKADQKNYIRILNNLKPGVHNFKIGFVLKEDKGNDFPKCFNVPYDIYINNKFEKLRD